MNEERLDNVETALAHHERQIADLSAMITDQWREIERLKRLLAAAQDKIADVEAMTGGPAANVKPPHY